MIHNHFSELSSLFSIYFGQDYDLFTDAETAEGVIDGFLEQNGTQVIRAILEEAKEFQATYAGRIYEGMAEHFSDEFMPESWGYYRGSVLCHVATKSRAKAGAA